MDGKNLTLSYVSISSKDFQFSKYTETTLESSVQVNDQNKLNYILVDFDEKIKKKSAYIFFFQPRDMSILSDHYANRPNSPKLCEMKQ